MIFFSYSLETVAHFCQVCHGTKRAPFLERLLAPLADAARAENRPLRMVEIGVLRLLDAKNQDYR